MDQIPYERIENENGRMLPRGFRIREEDWVIRELEYYRSYAGSARGAGYSIMKFPPVAFLETFTRASNSIGRSQQKIYKFLDRKGRELVLTPDSTAMILNWALQGDRKPLNNGKIGFIVPTFRYRNNVDRFVTQIGLCQFARRPMTESEKAIYFAQQLSIAVALVTGVAKLPLGISFGGSPTFPFLEECMAAFRESFPQIPIDNKATAPTELCSGMYCQLLTGEGVDGQRYGDCADYSLYAENFSAGYYKNCISVGIGIDRLVRNGRQPDYSVLAKAAEIVLAGCSVGYAMRLVTRLAARGVVSRLVWDKQQRVERERGALSNPDFSKPTLLAGPREEEEGRIKLVGGDGHNSRWALHELGEGLNGTSYRD